MTYLHINCREKKRHMTSTETRHKADSFFEELGSNIRLMFHIKILSPTQCINN